MAETKKDTNPGKGPAAKGKTGSSAGGSVFGQKAGPLPIWAWGVVALGSIYIATKIYGPKTAPSTANAGQVPPTSYPTSGAPVIVLPSSNYPPGAAAASTVPASGADGVPTDVAVNALVSQYKSVAGPQPPMTPAQQSQYAAFGNSFNALPAGQQASVGNFFQQNMARKQLNLPYFTGTPTNQAGTAQLYNPTTGAYTNISV